MNNREKLKDKQRIVVKVGTSSLIHKATGNINLFRLEKLVRVLTDLHNSGKDWYLQERSVQDLKPWDQKTVRHPFR